MNGAANAGDVDATAAKREPEAQAGPTDRACDASGGAVVAVVRAARQHREGYRRNSLAVEVWGTAQRTAEIELRNRSIFCCIDS